MPDSSHAPIGISKSRLLAFETCERKLWMQVHQPDLAAPDPATLDRMASGNDVGALARALHPDGHLISADAGLSAAVEETATLLSSGFRKPLFEATFIHDGMLVRADILLPVEGNAWDLVEVKSSGEIKGYQLHDLATQLWVIRESGVDLRRGLIRHINTSFTLQYPGQFDGLFNDVDLTNDIGDLIDSRAEVLDLARQLVSGSEPDIDFGRHCKKPNACEFISHCSTKFFDGIHWPVTVLPDGRGMVWLEKGVKDLADIPVQGLSDRQARVVSATLEDRLYHDADGARAAIAGWGWPRAWLDFETITFPIPRWIGTHPYEQVPFQFSLHLELADGKLEHFEFLDLTGDDPRAACANALAEFIPSGATIIAYNASFEKVVLKRLADALPSQAKRLLEMASNTVDLLPVTSRHWYHRDQKGSWSIKKVLPTMGVSGYGDLDVQDGGAAQRAYLESITPTTSEERKAELRQGLLAYCHKDTKAMIQVAKRLTTAAQ